MTHSIHGGIDGDKVVAEDDYIKTPNIIKNCASCHKGDVPVPVHGY